MGIAGTVVSTGLANTVAPVHDESRAATRAMLARTAMIFAARSDPRAMVLV
jgi:hypothetical protein